MYNEDYEATIDLKDLLFHLLYRWRSILLGGLVLCLLLGGYRAVKNLTTHASETETQEEYEKKVKEYQLALEKYELDQKVYQQNIDTYEKWLDQQNLYMEKSVLMHIDPYNKPLVSRVFYVELDKNELDKFQYGENLSLDPADYVIRAYTTDFDDSMWEPLEKLTGLDRTYLAELYAIGADYGTNTFSVTVTYNDLETAEKMADVIAEQMEVRHQNLGRDVAQHKLTLINETSTYAIDSGLASVQKGNADTVNTYTQYILDNRNYMESTEKPEEPEKAKVERVSVMNGLLKFLVLGFAGGIFLMAAFYGVKYLLTGVLRNGREIREQYGYQLLGVYSRSEKKRFLPFVDRLLERMEGTGNKIPEETVSQCVAANIINLAGEKRNLLLTGTISCEKLERVARSVSSELKDVQLQVMADMNRSPETLRQLAQCDGIVLVEERNVSKNSAVQVEQELIEAVKVPVIGYVLL